MEDVRIVKKYVAKNGNEYATSQEAKRENCRIDNRKGITDLFFVLKGDETEAAGIVISNADYLYIALKPFLSQKPKAEKKDGPK
jgi:hypothetical protein